MSTLRYLGTKKLGQIQVNNLGLSMRNALEIGLKLSRFNSINTPYISILDNDLDSPHDSIGNVMEGATRVPAIADFDGAFSDPTRIGFPNPNGEATTPIDDEPVMLVPASPKLIVPTLPAATLSPADSDEETDDLSLMTDPIPVSPVLPQADPILEMPFDDLVRQLPYGGFAREQTAATEGLTDMENLLSELEVIRSLAGYSLGETPTKKTTANDTHDLITAEVTARIYTIRKLLETLEGEMTMKLNYPRECKIAIDANDGVTPRDFDIVNESLMIQKRIAGGGAVPDKGLEHRLNFQILDYVNLNNIVVDNALFDSQEYLLGSVTLRGLLIKQQCLQILVNSG